MSFRHISLRHCACLALLAGIAGCGNGDPMQRAGTWQPENLNDANLAAMVADKHDLLRGSSDDDASPGALSAAAVRRLLTDHVKALPSTDIGPLAPTSAGAGGGP